MNHRHIDHRLAHPRVAFTVLAQQPIPAEPTKGSLHDLTLGQNSETYQPFYPTHDLQVPTIHDPDTAGRLLAGIAAIRPNLLQAWKAFLSLVQHRPTTIFVVNIGCMDHTRDQHSQDIDQHVPLAAANLLTDGIASFAAALRSLHRLAVEDGRGRRGLLASLTANRCMQRLVNAQPPAVATPTGEVPGHYATGREVVRQLPRLTASAFQIKDMIEDTAAIQAAAFVGLS
jgi:hypothetical protein